ncbi:MAG: LysM domain-containing protein [Luminiphilus sp.]|jgi:LysM repeat protein|nr:LysM peptidoglycan-binding domain-containing protein [Halieaceae bacterium]MDG2494484.1 LysM domain-containing protein [Luminiphilus sp.]
MMVLNAIDTATNIEGSQMVNRSLVGGGRRFLSKFAGLRFLWGFFFVFISVVSVAQPPSSNSPALNNDVPLNYVVQQGDTLWGISGVYLQEAWRWPELWDTNPQLDNPHRIYPGDVLALRWEGGRPRLGLSSRGGLKLSPNVRSQSLDTAIPPIPRDQIDPFLRNNRILESGAFSDLPYVIAGDAQRIISGLGDRIYVRGPVASGDQVFGIIREGSPVIDPTTQEVLGITALDIGSASLTSGGTEGSSDAVKEFEITRMTEEIRIGDRLIPLQAGIMDAFFQPKSPGVEIENGFMVAVNSGVTQIGPMSIVTINRGDREAVMVGDVFAIYQTGEIVQDPVKQEMVALPDVRAGVLMVFAVYEKASFGLVLTATRPLAVGDKIRNP